MEIDGARPRVEQIAALAIGTARRLGRKAGTLENKRNIWEVKVVAALRGQVAALVTHDDAQDLALKWAEEFGPHAALKAVKEARHGWRLAMRRGWLTCSPWDGVEVPGAATGPQPFMMREEREALRSYLEPIGLRGIPARVHRVTALALLTLTETPAGRLRETASLERRGLDFERRLVTYFTHKSDKNGPKQSVMTDYQAAVFDVAVGLAPGRWVFPSVTGSGPVQDLTKSMARVCERVGLPRYTPHALRRGIAQDAHEAGASIEDVQHMLGHESVKTTERYLRWSPVRARKALRLVETGGTA